MNNLEFIILIGLIFGLVTTLFFAADQFIKNDRTQLEKRINDRLVTLVASRATGEGSKLELLRERYRSELSVLDRLVLKCPGIEAALDHVDYLGSVRRIRNQVLGSLIASPIALHFVLDSTGNSFVAISIAMMILALPYLIFKWASARRLAEFERQFPEVLDSMTRALRAGYPLSDSIRLISEESSPPISSEFRILFEEINAGIELRTALLAMVDRVPSVSVMAFTTTILLQRETGGNLSENLAKISQVIRKRFNFERNLVTLTAEGRMSAWVLALIPIVLYGFMYLMNPETAGILIFDPEGRRLALVGFGLLGAGFFWIRRIVRIEV